MDYVKPSEVAETFFANAVAKAKLSISQLLLRGFLSGALLGFATAVTFTSTAQGLPPVVGAILFPVGFAMIVVLGLELVTGNFALMPAATLSGDVGLHSAFSNLIWVFMGNLLGGCLFAYLYTAVQTQFHHVPAVGPAALIVAAAQAKTIAYQHLGAVGWWLAFVKAILCNWMVCMGIVMAITARSTLGKIVACWLPVFTFFSLGYEHSVVNMFLIPAGMLMGAPISIREWWFWNQIPVTLGNLAGGLLFVGLPMLWMRPTMTKAVNAAHTPISAPEPFPHPRSSAVETR
jgi:formate/nitrite transporter